MTFCVLPATRAIAGTDSPSFKGSPLGLELLVVGIRHSSTHVLAEDQQTCSSAQVVPKPYDDFPDIKQRVSGIAI